MIRRLGRIGRDARLRWALWPALCLALVPGLWAGGMAAAADLRDLGLSRSATLPVERATYPVPAEPDQVFYIQRSMNPNTVVYQARFDAQGRLAPTRPVTAIWRRYNTDGALRDLSFVERNFGFGVRSRARADGGFDLRFGALPDLPVRLRETGPREAALFAAFGETNVRLVYAFLDLDQSKRIPRVTALRLHGIDPGSGRAITKSFAVTGGDITE